MRGIKASEIWNSKKIEQAARRYSNWNFKDESGKPMQFREVYLVGHGYLLRIK